MNGQSGSLFRYQWTLAEPNPKDPAPQKSPKGDKHCTKLLWTKIKLCLAHMQGTRIPEGLRKA
jgi:hypothetical protein